MDTKRQEEIFGIVLQNQPIGITKIAQKLTDSVSIPTLNRDLAALKKGKILYTEGIGPSTKYTINLDGLVFAKIDPDFFFKTEADQRKIIATFNHKIFDSLSQSTLFSKEEILLLTNLTNKYNKNIKSSTPAHLKKEFERLMIELSWKSSQIEGNTYDLLDTEQLLKYNIAAKNHSQEENDMLLNHKMAIEYIHTNADFFAEISVSKIIDIHSLLVKKLGIKKLIRKRIVRITGSAYTPPDISFVIEDSLERMCQLINSKKNIFEKALIAVLLISYIQPFEDGNKRTARLTANALLTSGNACPLSYRSVSPSDYKKAILLFYELNNITAFKQIFIDQYKFAVEHYF